MVSQATNQEAGTSDDFQDVGPPTKKKFVMDAAMEDKLCVLYDIFVDVIKIFPSFWQPYITVLDLLDPDLKCEHSFVFCFVFW